jgi:hypothetical protein
LDCYKGAGTTYGVNVVPGTTASAGILGYTVSPGYDDVTGLGSLNINGIVNGWSSVTPTFPSTTAFAAPSTYATPTTSVNLVATVTATGRGGTVAPAGFVEFFEGSTSGTNLGTAPVTSSCTGSGSSISCTGTATLALTTGSLTPGTYSVVAYFEGDGANDAPSTSSSQSLTIYGAPQGTLESAIDASTGSTTIPTTDSIYIGGWAADYVDGSPVSSVVISIDGNAITSPTLGLSRPDVEAAYSNPAFLNSGFDLYYPAAGLAGGSHTITAVATNKAGVSTTYPALTFNVTYVYPAPVGNLETAVDSSNGSTTVKTSDSIYINGWIADPTDGSPMTNVKVYIDGNSIGTPTLGIARPDVAAAYGSAYANSGFTMTYSASSLSVGSHSISVVGINSHSVQTALGPLTINVVKPTVPVGSLDSAVDLTTGSSTFSQSSGDTLYVGGWAADYTDNGPAKSVQIFIDGSLLGTASLGYSRPDVAAYYNNNNWTNSGYEYFTSVSALGQGTHSITAVAKDSQGNTTTLGPSSITVTP